MKAAWLAVLWLGAAACGSSGAEGPRGAASPASRAGSSASAGAESGGATAAGGSSPGPSASGSSVVAGAAGAGEASGGTASAGSASGGSGSGGVAAGGGGGGPLVHPSQRTVVYLPSYRGPLATWAGKLDFSEVTNVHVCFAAVDPAGGVSYPDAALDPFVAAAHAKGVAVSVAIGGGAIINDGGVFATVLQDATRGTLVSNLVAFADAHQLDGIDVDLEGNGVNQYYEAFVTALAAQLHADGKQMTAAVASWFGDGISATALAAFDFVSVMAYDLHNPGGSSVPLQSSSIAEATKEVDWWVKRGLPQSKAVFGVPFYGYRWSGGQGEALTYAEILAQDPAAATQDQLDLGGATVFLNSRTTITSKAALAKSYGGIMVWELGQDAPGDASLLKAIFEASK